MAYKNIFENPEFDEKFDRVKSAIKIYLNEINYDLGELEIENIIGWNDVGEKRLIYANEKCPSDIKIPITNLIKEEFPKPNEAE